MHYKIFYYSTVNLHSELLLCSTTMGFGDLYAYNQREQVLFIFIFISGVIFFGWICASMAARQKNLDGKRARFYDRMHAIKKYMLHEHVPPNLRKRVIRYYDPARTIKRFFPCALP